MVYWELDEVVLFSSLMAFCVLKISPSLIIYFRLLYRVKFNEDSNISASLVWPPEPRKTANEHVDEGVRREIRRLLGRMAYILATAQQSKREIVASEVGVSILYCCILELRRVFDEKRVKYAVLFLV